MIVKNIEGNAVEYVLDHDDALLLHVCNNKAVMGSGIALEIKNKIPSAYENYMIKSQSESDEMKRLGSISFSTDLSVCNMTSQDGFGEGIRHLHYGALVDCLTDLVFVINNSHKTISKIVIPYLIGSDRAGGDWETVFELIAHFVSKTKIDELIVVKK